MTDIVISEFMDEAAVEELRRDFSVTYDKGLVDRPEELAGLVAAARSNRENLALRGLLFGAVRNDDAASSLLFGVDTLDHDAVVKRTEFHAVLLMY